MSKQKIAQVVETTLVHSKGDENKLAAHVKAITKLTDGVKKSVFEIAVRMNAVNTERLYEIGGYSNIAEWAAAELGYARSTTLNYVKIAERFLEVDTTASKGKMVINTICARRDESGAVTADYKIGQLNAAGRATADDFVTMDSEGVISPDMSADAIKKAVKTWYDGEPEEDEPEDDGEPEDSGDDSDDYWNKWEFVMRQLQWLGDNAPSGEIADATKTAYDALQSVESQDYTEEGDE